ncbi:MAG: sulfatase-like hydrolase/transferase [Planktomarina sp.]|nr:sulfatase-like hydrolase/transferase [Planktomarina sp.]
MIPPNFILIMTDQHRADHLGCSGNNTVRTSNLDALAQTGTQFSKMYVANPVCMPNRASIMTGRLSSVHGGRDNGIPMSRDHTTFVDVLKDAGYKTSLIGKSHLQNFMSGPPVHKFELQKGLTPSSSQLREAIKTTRSGPHYNLENAQAWPTPLMQRANQFSNDFYGFEHAEVCTGHGDGVGGDYLLWAREQDPNIDSLRGPKNALPKEGFDAPQAFRSAVPTELHPTTWITDRSIAKLKEYGENNSHPFFMQISYPDPHHPFAPPGEYWGSYDPHEMDLSASFHYGNLPAVQAMRDALKDGSSIRNGTQPFAVSEGEARVLTALSYSMITMIDEAIGRVLASLSEQQLERDTVVIFTSDHGDMMGDYGIMLKRYFHNQGVIRVPFVWNDSANRATTLNADLCSSIDISATILARAGLQPFHGCQGRDLFSSTAPMGVLVEEDIQRPMIGTPPLERIRTYVSDSWRITLRANDGCNELFNLNDDPSEIRNLFGSDEAKETQAELSAEMLKHTIAFQDQSPLPTGRA